MKKDYYEILGIDRDADAAAIKKAFRAKAIEFHPDHNPDDQDAAEKFREVQEAYEVLSDPNGKSYYDRHGHDSDNGGIFGFGGFGPPDFAEAMGFVFSSAPKSKFVHPDIRIQCKISLKDAICGVKPTLSYPIQEACSECVGTGIVTYEQKCSTCNGSGTVFGGTAFFKIKSPCQQCHGTGKKISQCKKCKGAGTKSKTKKLKVDIPAAIPSGGTMRVGKQGNKVYIQGDLFQGDVYVTVVYPECQDGVKLDNGNIYVSVQIPFDVVMREEEVEVDILGCKTVKIQLDMTKPSGHE